MRKIRRGVLACNAGVLIAAVAIACTTAARGGPQGAPDEKDRKMAFDAAYACGSQTQLWGYVASLLEMPFGTFEASLNVFSQLGSVTPAFVRDDEGRFNPKATKEAFAAAVHCVTPALLAEAASLTGESNRKLTFNALVSASDSFVHEAGQFNKRAFLAAFRNLTPSSVAKASNIMNTGKSNAMSYLLAAAGTFVDSKGDFSASAFNDTLAALGNTPLSGTEEARIRSFLSTMTRHK